MNFNSFSVLGLMVSTCATCALAEPAAKPAPVKAGTELLMTADKGSEFQLEVRQMPLAQVLKEVTAKTGIPVHYSVLPEGFITATCVGQSLKPVLECLINKKADIIVRYAKAKNAKAKSGQIAEAWVLGAKLEAVPNSALCTTASGQGTMELKRHDETTEAETDVNANQSNLLLKIAQTGKPQERAEAIGNLLTIGAQNDPKVKALLEEAIHDKDANVRAQAVSTLTHRSDYDENAAAIIQEAMQDSSVDVRMMAVDGIVDDEGLLRQAVNDSDETVRMLAKMKLDELLQKQKSGNQ
jgi:hypothetical protein